MKYQLTEKDIAPYRPKPFLFITTCDKNELTVEEFKKTLIHIKKSGFGGIVLFNKPIEGFNAEKYLSDEWFAMIEHAAIVCKELELDMWINDGFDYPPGSVAGKIEKLAPELKQKHITLIDGKPTVIEAEWGFPAFEELKSGELFRTLVYEQYEKNIGEYFHNPITAFFSDADNRRVQPSAMFDENSPMRNYFPWSSDFESSFKQTYGYDIMPYMTDVLLRKDIPQAVNYWEHAGRLYQRWFKGNHEWLQAHGLIYTGHSGDSSPYLQTDAPRSSCFTEGRFSDVQKNWDYPGTDQELYAIDGGKHMVKEHWYCPSVSWGDIIRVPKMTGYADVSADMRAKQASSTAFMYNKKGVMCEMNAASNNGVEPWVLKHIAAFQIMQGVTHVVMHEYIYRYLDQIKYFAPPNYSKHSMLQYSMDVINREIAELTCMMNKGKSVCPIALIDPTEYVWRGKYRKDEYFNAFAKLNRLPYGFTICDIDKILTGDYGFKVAVYAGIDLSDQIKSALTAKGISVLDENSFNELQNLIACDVKYVGEGTPHFVRKIIDGEEFTFIANIESEKPVKGVISAYGKTKELFLYPGDVRYISKTYDDIPENDEPGIVVYRLERFLPVEFDRPNVIQLEYFKSNEKTVTKLEPDKEMDFIFNSKEALKNLKLYIPYVRNKIGTSILNENEIHIVDGNKNIVESVTFNGKKLPPTDGKVFDEKYLVYSLPETIKGENVITIEKTDSFEPHSRLILEGDFDVLIDTDRKNYKQTLAFYNMCIYIPEHAKITVSSRSAKLRTDKSIALQGQPFYSGAVTYNFQTNVGKYGKYRLTLPSVRDAAYLYDNGKFIGKTVKPPYTFKLNLEKGLHEFKLTIYNSMANCMECYLEDGGLLSGGYIEKI